MTSFNGASADSFGIFDPCMHWCTCSESPPFESWGQLPYPLEALWTSCLAAWAASCRRSERRKIQGGAVDTGSVPPEPLPETTDGSHNRKKTNKHIVLPWRHPCISTWSRGEIIHGRLSKGSCKTGVFLSMSNIPFWYDLILVIPDIHGRVDSIHFKRTQGFACAKYMAGGLRLRKHRCSCACPMNNTGMMHVPATLLQMLTASRSFTTTSFIPRASLPIPIRDKVRLLRQDLVGHPCPAYADDASRVIPRACFARPVDPTWYGFTADTPSLPMKTSALEFVACRECSDPPL